MGDNFKALFKVFDAQGNAVGFEEARSEFAAIYASVMKGYPARTAEMVRIINL
jgi:hypothetical protein